MKLFLGLCSIFLVYDFVVAQNALQDNGTTNSVLQTPIPGLVVLPETKSLSSLTASATTTAAAQKRPFILNRDLPLPSDLTKTAASATSLNIRYTPPEKYLTDKSYTHFRVEYRRYHGAKWETVSINKTADANNLVLHDLLEGVLYLVRMRTQTHNNFGILVVSQPTQSIEARTRPLPVTRLTAIQSSSNGSEVILSWIDAPLEAFRSKYDTAILTYYIEDLPVNLREIFPIRHLTFERSSVLNGRNVVLEITPGATYRFEVVTISTGTDETTSEVTSLSKKFEIPGPINLRRGSYNETTMLITWDGRPDVDKTTEFQVSWQKEENMTIISSNTTCTSILLSSLDPGALYEVTIRSIQADNLFGKLSNASSFKTRTQPPALDEIRLTQRNVTTITYSFRTPSSDQFHDVIITYKIRDLNTEWIEAPDVQVNETIQIGSVSLTDLRSGALYRINMTVITEPNPKTSNSIIKFARTRPRLPTDISTVSTGGTLYLSWRAPDIYPSVMWRYRVDYHPINIRFSNETRSLCRDNGQALSKIILSGIEPGTGYAIFVTTIAGENCEGGSTDGYVTESLTSQQHIAYTQPAFPRIESCKQATVSAVRVLWLPPEGDKDMRFEHYIVGVKRLKISDNVVAYEKEEFTQEFRKDQHSAVLNLSQGAYYRINVTTATGPKRGGQTSIVIPKINSVQFKTWHRYYDHFAIPRLEWKFTTCDKTGRFGPSQRVCNSSYEDTNLQELVEVREGIQHWVAPVDGLYRITAAGAGYERRGGSGAVVSGLFHLKEGAGLKIAVGQRGSSRSVEENEMTMGGGGGTFVVAGDSTTQKNAESDEGKIMLVAGGAGRSAPSIEFANAKLSYRAGNGSEIGVEYGLGGVADNKANISGKRGFVGTGGGAGFYGIADSPVTLSEFDSASPAVGFEPFAKHLQFLNESERRSVVPLTGGRYETRRNSYSEGGFGGGGCGYFSAGGGGGGYSGGGGGPRGGYSGGGGSFIRFTGGKEMGEVTNDQPGFVIIRVVGLPLVSPLPVTFYLVISFIVGIVTAFLCGASLYGVSKCADKHFSKDRIATKAKPTRTSEQAAVLDGSEENSSAPTANQVQPTVALNRNSDSSSSSDDESSATEGSYDMDEGQPSRFTLEKSEFHSGESDSLSSDSPVSSMATGVNEKKFVVDPNTGKLLYRGRNSSHVNSSFTGFESSDTEDKVVDNGSAPLPPPTSAPEFAMTETQKEEFRKNCSMFQKLVKKKP